MTQPRCTQPPSDKAATAARDYRAALPVFETERLELRAPSMDDFPAWEKIVAEAFKETGEDAWLGFCNYIAGWTLHGHGCFAVFLKGRAQAIGFVSLGLEWEDHEPELGYFFDAEFHGQGYATEACKAVRDFGTDLLGSGNFVSYVKNTNVRSNAMATRLGAVRDAKAENAIGENHHVWRHGVPA